MSISCNVIEGDVIENPEVNNPDTGQTDSVEIDFTKKVLIEEYTGHQCGFCPGAARIIYNLKKNVYVNDELVVIAIHAGVLAEPKPDFIPKPEFKSDFRTSIGNSLDAAYGVSQTIPKALIDRVEYQGTQIIAPGSFNEVISNILDEHDKSPIAITANISFNEDDLTIPTSVTIHTSEEINEDINLSVMVTEDSIIDWQKNYPGGDQELPDGELENYPHMHMLRGSMNGAWGDLINSTSGTSISADESITKSYSYTLGIENNSNFINIVAFVYKVDNDEVLQVKEFKLKDYLD